MFRNAYVANTASRCNAHHCVLCGVLGALRHGMTIVLELDVQLDRVSSGLVFGCHHGDADPVPTLLLLAEPIGMFVRVRNRRRREVGVRAVVEYCPTVQRCRGGQAVVSA